MNTIQHTNARKIGAEWVCLQAIRELISGNQEWCLGFQSIYKVAPSLYELKNALGEKVHMRLCSEPNKSADDIYERLKYKKNAIQKNQNREKFVVHSTANENRKVLESRKNG